MTRLNAPRTAQNGQELPGLDAGPSPSPSLKHDQLPGAPDAEPSLPMSMPLADTRQPGRIVRCAVALCLMVTVAVLAVWGTQFGHNATVTPVALAAETLAKQVSDTPADVAAPASSTAPISVAPDMSKDVAEAMPEAMPDKKARLSASTGEEPVLLAEADAPAVPKEPDGKGAAGKEPAEARDGDSVNEDDKKPEQAEPAKSDAPTKPAAGKSKPPSIKLFGTVEFRGTLKGVPSWTSMLERNKKKPLLVAGAKLNASTNWDDLKKKLEGMSPMEQLKAVNRFWNQWPYRLDPEVYKKPDYWATPDEFRRNSGDCEDYSIVKYHTLKELGFSPDDMRIVVLMETIRNIAHAVLVVYMDGDAWVLDNLSNSVLSHSRYKNYDPQFSVNEKFRWAHVRPK